MGGYYIIQSSSTGYYKDSWYRIIERERKKWGTTFVKDEEIACDRYVVRAGYLYQPEDCPYNTQRSLAISILLEQYEKVLKDYKRKHQGEDPGMITKSQIELMLKALDTAETRVLRHMLYKARGRWLAEVQTDQRLRTLWYDDCKNYKNETVVHGKIIAIVIKAIGTTWPATGGMTHTYYGDDYDYEPGGIDVWSYQRLYKVQTDIYGKILVHPLDAMKWPLVP